MHGLRYTLHARIHAKTHARTPARSLARTIARRPPHARYTLTRTHAHPGSISLPPSSQTHKHHTPLTAPELADDTTYSGSSRTCNAAACAHTRIGDRHHGERESHAPRQYFRRHTQSLSLPTRPAWPVKLAHSSPVNRNESGRGPASVKMARESITRLGNVVENVARARVVTDMAGWGRYRYLALAAATHSGPILAAGQSLTD
jgi:hypothetical protein